MKKLPKNLVVCVAATIACHAVPALAQIEQSQPPRVETIHRYLLDAYTKRRDFSNAEREYKELLKLRSNDATLHYNFSLFMAQQGKLGAALIEMDKARKLDPNNADFESARQKLKQQMRLRPHLNDGVDDDDGSPLECPGDFEQNHPTRTTRTSRPTRS